jgi:DNA helicase-2/ATP-dependent DNA helicase PcrA
MDVDTTDLSTSVKTKVGVFRDLIGALRFDMASMKFVDFAGALVEKAGFEKYYRGTGKEEDENRWQNIEEFLTFVQENFEDNEKITLDNFLQELALDNGSDTDGDDDINTVTIATMHSAKGLEFKVVFIVACEEGIIPSVQSIRNADGVDEERRVMYVAVTRAQERLFISAVRGVRRRFYKTEEVRPSRFFDEARGENRESLRAFSKGGNEIGAPSGKYVESRSEKKNVYIQPKADIDHEPKILKKSAEGFRTGAKISHKKYGRGTVISVSGEGIATTVTVAFPGLGVKKFALMSAPIELIND